MQSSAERHQDAEKLYTIAFSKSAESQVGRYRSHTLHDLAPYMRQGNYIAAGKVYLQALAG